MAEHLREDFDAVCAERDLLWKQVNGDGSASADPLRGLGLRACLELQAENIALLLKRAEIAEAALAQLRKVLHAKMRDWQHRIDNSDAEPECVYLAQLFVDELEAL